jgi:hypothetical protein
MAADLVGSSGGVQVFPIRSPRAALPADPRLRVVTAVLAAALTLALGALAAEPARASLAAVGPVNPATGFPDWYQDGNGLKLQLCLDGPPLCLAAADELVAPDGEAFWWQAEAVVPAGGGTARLVLAQEAAFVDGARTSFGRVRVTLTGARPNTTYAVTHPYWTLSVATDATGGGRTSTDVGCAGAPCTFSEALGTPVTTFLTWDTTPPNSAPPAGHIGDALTPHRVVGGSNGNRFTVSGLGGGGTTDLFTVQGKLAGPPVPVFSADRRGLEFGPAAPGAQPVLRTATITNLGVPAADGASNLGFGPVGISGPNATDYTLVGNTCLAPLAAGQSCAVTVAFKPGLSGLRVASLDVVHNGAGAGTRIPLSGTGTEPSAIVAGTSAANRLRVTRLRTTHRMSRARVLRRGLRLSMRLPVGTEVLKVAVYRVRNGRVVRRPVWLSVRIVGRISPNGLYRIRLDSRTLRRRLKAGLYQVNVTPGVSRRQLGTTTSTRVRITRR